MKIACGLFCVAFCLSVGVPQSRAASICNTNPANLVANCGFETGDFTSWTLAGNDVPLSAGVLYGVEGVDPFDGISPHSGVDQAFIADLVSNSLTLSQTIATVPTDVYTVSWYLAQDTPVAGTYSNALSATFGATTLVSLKAVPVEGYTLYSYSVAATSASTVLNLTLGNDLGEFLLDDVSVVPAPTPEPSTWTDRKSVV